MAFWDRAADGSRLSWPRVGLMLARCTIVAIVAGAYLWMIISAKSAAWTAALAYGCGAAFLSLTYVNRYFQWQAAVEYEDVRAPLLRLAWVPLLVAAGFGLPYATGHDAWAWALCGLAFITMLFRYVRRNAGPAKYYGWMAYLIIVIIAIPTASAAATMLLWAMDAWAHRRVLRLRRKRSPEFELSG